MPNNPYLDSSVEWRIKSGTIDLHEAGYRSTADAILTSGLATGIVGMISSGKEADVYLAVYNGAPIAVKSYRLYRTSHKGGGPIKLDAQGWLAAKEFEMTRQAWKGGARVPAPARRVENMFSMRYLGTEDGPAPKLHEVDLEEPEVTLGKVLDGVQALARAGVVHSDLSVHNILMHEGEPWFIDLSEAIRVDRTGGVPWMRLCEATVALERGMRSIEAYFRKYGLEVPSQELTEGIVRSIDRFDVLD